MDHHTIYMRRASEQDGAIYAKRIGQFQADFLNSHVATNLDEAFELAVEAYERDMAATTIAAAQVCLPDACATARQITNQ